MKTLLYLFCAAAIVAMMTGCDPQCTYVLYVKNGTDTDLVVEINGFTPKTIHSGEEEWIDNLVSYGNDSVDRFSPEEEILLFRTLKINGNVMPNSVWKRKYWYYTRISKSNSRYTLEITDKRLENLTSEEPNKIKQS